MSDDYDHDVFVSYSHRDREWVMNTLVPRLRNEGLEVYTDDDFDIGTDFKKNMARAVLGSRCTIVVLTPDFVDSQWGNFEADVALQTERLFPVLLRQCTVPAAIANKTCAEFIDQWWLEREMTRLLAAVKRAVAIGVADQHPPTNLTTQRSTTGEVLAMTAQRFQNLDAEIVPIGDLNEARDQLHRLRVLCVEPITRDASRMAEDVTAADSLALYADMLQVIVNELRQTAARPTFKDHSLEWLSRLEAARWGLDTALGARDPDALRRAAREAEGVIAFQEPRISTQAIAATRALNVRQVTAEIAGIWARALTSNAALAELDRLEGLYGAVRQVTVEFESLGRDADRWQAIELEVQRIETTLHTAPAELGERWPYVRQMMTELTAGAEWAKELESHAAALEKALEQQDTRAAHQHFRVCRHRIMIRFSHLHRRIKQLCQELRGIAGPLADIAGAVQS